MGYFLSNVFRQAIVRNLIIIGIRGNQSLHAGSVVDDLSAMVRKAQALYTVRLRKLANVLHLVVSGFHDQKITTVRHQWQKLLGSANVARMNDALALHLDQKGVGVPAPASVLVQVGIVDRTAAKNTVIKEKSVVHRQIVGGKKQRRGTASA